MAIRGSSGADSLTASPGGPPPASEASYDGSVRIPALFRALFALRALRAIVPALLVCGAGLHGGPVRAEPSIDGTVRPGGVVRWPGPKLLSCERSGQRWEPFAEACWYPVDLDESGEIEIVRRSTGGVASRRIRIGDYPYAVQHLTVEEKYVSPPASESERIERESREVGAVLNLRSPRRFTLPLDPPLASLPAGGRFGSRRFFNGEPRKPHSGADFAASTGTPVLAVADGTVVLADHHYFAGKSIFVDHGGGLVSMSFHLSEIGVTEGETVRRGQAIGKVGATGRVTGAHLHFGLRWLGARVDPETLIGEARPADVR